MSDFSRREFLERSVASGVAGGLVLTGMGRHAEASVSTPVGTMIDLTKCDGCKTLDEPACVTACREENKGRFPEPIKENWPLLPGIFTGKIDKEYARHRHSIWHNRALKG